MTTPGWDKRFRLRLSHFGQDVRKVLQLSSCKAKTNEIVQESSHHSDNSNMMLERLFQCTRGHGLFITICLREFINSLGERLVAARSERQNSEQANIGLLKDRPIVTEVVVLDVVVVVVVMRFFSYDLCNGLIVDNVEN